MDIEGAEYQAFDDIFAYQKNITGIVLELHFTNKESTDKAVKLLHYLNKNFLLLHVHGNNTAPHKFATANSIGHIPNVLELTYINKNLVHKYELAKNQKHPTSIDQPTVAGSKDDVFEILL